MRRGALNPFFSKRTVSELERSIKAKVEKMCGKLAKQKGKIVEMGTVFTALTLDVITEYCYGQCQGCLDEGDFAPRWKQLMVSLFESTSVSKHFPVVQRVLSSLPRAGVRVLNPDFVPFFEAQDLITTRAREIWQEWQRSDVEQRRGVGSKTKEKEESHDGKAKTIFHGILQSSLPDSEKTSARMADEAFVLIVAGGETTARVATTILAHLVLQPDLLKALRKAIAPVMSGPNLPSSHSLEEIPLIRAVIREGLRLSAPVTNRPMLISPDEDLKYGDGWVIPRGTPMSMTLQSVLFDPEVFDSPKEFRPGRWLEAAKKGERLERFLVPFSKGSRMCIGTNIAYAELYLAIAALVSRFHFEFEDFDMARDLETVRDCFVGMPMRESKGVRVKVKSIVE